MSNVTFEDTLFADWLKKNRTPLIAGLLIVCGFWFYQSMAPRWKASGMEKDWNLYATLAGEIDLENMGDTLARARSNDTIYPWFVLQLVALALSENDTAALQELDQEVGRLRDSGAADGLRWSGPDGGEPLVDHMAGLVSTRLAGGTVEIANPTEGELLEMDVNVGPEATYTLTMALFPDAAPEAVAAFLAALEAGTMNDQMINVVGQSFMRFEGLGAPDDEELENLPLERAEGHYHTEGALTTTPAGGATPREQSAATWEIMMTANYFQDGRRSVFGQVTEGWDELKEAIIANTENAKVVVGEIRRKI